MRLNFVLGEVPLWKLWETFSYIKATGKADPDKNLNVVGLGA